MAASHRDHDKSASRQFSVSYKRPSMIFVTRSKPLPAARLASGAGSGMKVQRETGTGFPCVFFARQKGGSANCRPSMYRSLSRFLRCLGGGRLSFLGLFSSGELRNPFVHSRAFSITFATCSITSDRMRASTISPLFNPPNTTSEVTAPRCHMLHRAVNEPQPEEPLGFG